MNIVSFYTPPCPSNGIVPNEYRPYAYCGLHKAVACMQRLEVGIVTLWQAKDRDNARNPSDEHLWAPLGKQLKCPLPTNVAL